MEGVEAVRLGGFVVIVDVLLERGSDGEFASLASQDSAAPEEQALGLFFLRAGTMGGWTGGRRISGRFEGAGGRGGVASRPAGEDGEAFRRADLSAGARARMGRMLRMHAGGRGLRTRHLLRIRMREASRWAIGRHADPRPILRERGLPIGVVQAARGMIIS